MNLHEIATALSLTPVTSEETLNRPIEGCYAGDLLSCAMAKAKSGDLWLTVQSHANVVAVAVMLDLAGVVVTEGANIDAQTIQKASSEGVPFLRTEETTYAIAGKLWELGIRTKIEVG
jgi:predicted transcriptional regulator